MLKYARGCVEINSIGNILLLPAIGKAVKENHNSYYNVEIHEAQAYGNLRLLLPLTRSDINSKHLFHMVLESGKPKIKLARDSV